MKNMKVLAEEILQGKHDEILKEIYVDESVLEYTRENVIKRQLKNLRKFLARVMWKSTALPADVKSEATIQTIRTAWFWLHPLTRTRWLLWADQRMA